MSRTYLAENKTYKVGADCPRGYYLLTSNTGKQDAEFNRYTEYPPKSTYTRFRCYYGCVEVGGADKFVRIENGKAVYLGSEPLNLYKLLESARIEAGKASNSGETVFENNICKIKVHFSDSGVHLYGGDCVAEVSDQIIFSVNNHFFWTGKVTTHTFKPYRSIVFSFRYGLLRKTYTVGENGSSFRNIDKVYFSSEDNPVRLYRKGNESYYLVDLPKDIRPSQIALDWLRPTSSTKNCYPTDKSILEFYSKEYGQLASILSKYVELGIDIDIGSELKQLDTAPDFAGICSAFLRDLLIHISSFNQARPVKNKQYTFHVGTSYDKKYYCAVKLAEKAVNIQANSDKTVYYVTFDETQTNEISLMYYNLVSQFNADKDYMQDIRAYLDENCFTNQITNAIEHFISELREKYGYSGFVTNSVLVRINKSISKNKRRELDKLYNEMIEERRVTTKWSSEYKLFSVVQNLVADAIYQYRCIWLGAQSFDVFLPSQSIAIEYQGQQHYEPVEAFGGQEAFENNIERDARKRRLSEENGVRVLDWKYDVPVTEESVRSFLLSNGVAISTNPRAESTMPTDDILLEMAPVQENSKEKEKPVRLLPNVIRQYDLNGHFLQEYDSIKEASSLTGVSEKSIRKVVYGYRKSGGSYIWKQVPRESIVEDIAPIIQAENTGIGRAILQMDLEGNIVAEYPSKRAAAASTGINARGISDALGGVQKTAGGFVWTYKEE